MANRLPPIFQQFFDSTPNVRSGSVLRFYAAGTTTPLAVYSDSDLSVSLGTSITLNALGQPPTAVFLQNLAYKVRLEDADGNEIWTSDDVSTSDFSATARFTSGNGSPNGFVAGTAGSASTSADAYWDFTGQILYICTTTGDAASAVWTAINSSTAAAVVPQPQGRLTFTSATPIMPADVSAPTSVYYTPYLGSLIPLYNGSVFVPTVFAELTLALVASHTLNSNFDIFAYNNSGVVTIVTGPAWNSDTARGTGAGTTELTRINGIWVNAVSMTARNGSTTYTVAANRGTYLGTVRTTSAGQSIWTPKSAAAAGGNNARLFLWNAYNRVLVRARSLDSTASWSYTSTTVRAANNSASNRINWIDGLQQSPLKAEYSAIMNANATLYAHAGVALDSTTAITGAAGFATSTSSSFFSVARGTDFFMPQLGQHFVSANEAAQGATVTFISGGEDGSGLFAEIEM